MTNALRLIVAVLVCAFALPAAASATPGDLDPTFGTGGVVTTDFGGRGDAALAVAVQPDGKLVAVGNSSASGVFNVDFALARYTSNGAPDPVFGSGGVVLSDFGSTIDAASDVIVQPDGKLVVDGTSSRDFAVARYNSDGSLDPSFGSGGLVTTDFGGFDQATGLVRQGDGKLIAVGLGGNADFLLARYNPDGSLDPSFGSGGKVVTDFGSFDQAFDAAVEPDGKIVAGGWSGGDFALARYLPDGTLDPAFGAGGKVTTDFGGFDVVQGMAMTSTGKLVLAGSSAHDFALSRYNADGSLDTSFDGDGRVTTDFSSGSDDQASAVVVESNGSITAGGFTSPGAGSTSMALARYDSSGALDPSFGNGGTKVASFGNALNNLLDLALQPDGRLVGVGVTGEYGTGVTDFGVARFLGTLTKLRVTVDIKPESTDNVVPLAANGVLPVAILSASGFDAATVDPRSVCFGDAEAPAERTCAARQPDGRLEDVNGDGRPDLLLLYEVAKTGIDPGDRQACLTGTTRSGVPIEGCDRVTTR